MAPSFQLSPPHPAGREALIPDNGAPTRSDNRGKSPLVGLRLLKGGSPITMAPRWSPHGACPGSIVPSIQQDITPTKFLPRKNLRSPKPRPLPFAIEEAQRRAFSGDESGYDVALDTTIPSASGWVTTKGHPDNRFARALAYARKFYYKYYRNEFSSHIEALSHLICNLRNYYLQDIKSTIEILELAGVLMPDFTIDKKIAIDIWHAVASYTPSLALGDERTKSRSRAQILLEDVKCLLDSLPVGEKILVSEFNKLFREQFEHIPPPTDTAIGRAVGELTGSKSFVSNGKRYYRGFSSPSTN